jgi:dienelactone hydrolase
MEPIPVAKIRGPVFLDCGEHDSVWPSCDHAKAMMAELAAAHVRFPHELLAYPAAGHAICTVLPYTPGLVPAEEAFSLGGTNDVANALARAAQWPKLLAYLRN